METNKEQKVLGLVSICRKAGKISLGLEDSVKSIKSGKVKLVLLCSDISANTKREILFQANHRKIPQLSLEATKEAFGEKVGVREVACAAVLDAGFAKAMLNNMADNNRG